MATSRAMESPRYAMMALMVLMSWSAGCEREVTPAFERLPGPAQVKAIKERLGNIKDRIGKTEAYGCCIKGSCDWCLLNAGTCRCGQSWMNKQPVCLECDYHWSRGDSLTGGMSYAQRDSLIRAFQSKH